MVRKSTRERERFENILVRACSLFIIDNELPSSCEESQGKARSVIECQDASKRFSFDVYEFMCTSESRKHPTTDFSGTLNGLPLLLVLRDGRLAATMPMMGDHVRSTRYGQVVDDSDMAQLVATVPSAVGW